MRRSFHPWALAFTCLLLSSASAVGQEEVKIGLSLGKHVGKIRSKSVSLSDGLIATVSEDRTLKIWEYPSATFIRSINLPEAQGNASRLGKCRFLNRDVVLVANDSGFEYEFRQAKESSRKGTSSSNRVKSYGYYVVDWRNGVILDRVDGLSAPVLDFALSPGRDLLLVSTNGDACALYDSKGMRCVSSFTFAGERVLGASFVGNDAVVFVTDRRLYRFEITRYSNVHFVQRKLVFSEPLPRTVRHEVNRATFSEDLRFVYLFGREGFLCALETSSGARRNGIIPNGYHADTVRRAYPDSLKVQAGGKEEVVPFDKRYRKAFDSFIGKVDVTYSLAPTLEDQLPDSLFVYRMFSAPVVRRTHDGFDIQYEGQRIWHFDKDGLLVPSVGYDAGARLPRERHYYKEGIVEGARDWILFSSRNVEYDHGLLFLNGPAQDPALGRLQGDSITEWLLPAEPDEIYPWVNENHVLVSLKDGTLRWYNARTGEEELALFLADDDRWILWMPDGKYLPSVPEAANMIEWRYQSLARIETKKPMDNRRAFHIPGVVEDFVAQLYDDTVREPEIRRLSSLDQVLRIDDVAGDAAGGYTILYSLVGYDPAKYGSYELTLVLDGKAYSDFVHFPHRDRGIVQVSPGREVKTVGLGITTDVGNMAPDFFPLSREVFDRVHLTGVGVADYQSVLFPALNGPLNDARDVVDLLSLPDVFGKARRRPSVLLRDQSVTEASLDDRLLKLKEDARKNDLAVFYFSGHGVAEDSTFFFVLADGSRLNMNRFAEACAELPCPVLFIIDACYSGLMTGGTWANIAVLASSDKETKSVDSRDHYSRSRFTDSLIREVQGGISRRESLTLEELYDRLLDDCKGPAQPELKNMSHEIKVLEYE
jgi:hypothetical protein